MRSKLILLGMTLLLNLGAETIGNVEYKLPKSAENWKKADELKNDDSLTLIFIPADKTKEETVEYFTAHTNTLPMGDLPTDPQIIVGMLQPQFGNEKVQAKLLKSDPKSVTFEWWTEEAGKEKTHGWFRFIKSDKGLVLLGYQTQDPAAVEKARKEWLAEIDNAKELNNVKEDKINNSSEVK